MRAPFVPEDARRWTWRARPARRWSLVLNKIDLVKEKARLLPLIEQYKAAFEFVDYLPVSAAKGKGLDDLRRAIVERLPEGPAYFPEDHVTDQPERFLAAELVREKVLLATRQEVPHSVTVMVDRWEETPGLRASTPPSEWNGKGRRESSSGRTAPPETDRHAGAARDGAAVRYENILGPARASATRLAGEEGLPRRARLAYNDR